MTRAHGIQMGADDEESELKVRRGVPTPELSQALGFLDEHDLVAGLVFLREEQRPLCEAYGHDNLSPDNLARYATALMIEAAEFANETPWKIWKRVEPDPEKLAEEMVDLLHFVGTWLVLLELMGVSGYDLAKSWREKHARNVDRMYRQVAAGEIQLRGTETGRLSVSGPNPTADPITGETEEEREARRPEGGWPAIQRHSGSA